MSVALVDEQQVRPSARPVPDGRPVGHSWSPTSVPPLDQPALRFAPEAPVHLGPPHPTGHAVHVVTHPWSARPSTLLPDARAWCASLALAVAETLQGRRPVGQLSRWVDESVLATLNTALDQRRPPPGRTPPAVRPALVRSVHLQFPQPNAVEAAAHVQVDRCSAALAFRLEAWFDRWLCTALELGPTDVQSP